MSKNFLRMSKSDARALVVISLLLFLYITGMQFYRLHTEQGDEGELLSDSTAMFASKYTRYNGEKWRHHRYYDKRSKIAVSLFPFDPNTADSITLLRVGLKWYQVKNLLKYRRAGGRFRTPDALARLYGLSEKEFLRLRPYIRIEGFSQETTAATDSTSVSRPAFTKVEKYAEGTVLELNSIDTTELKRVPGIGSGYAKVIMRYRDELGGFHSAEQLKDISFLPTELVRWFRVSKDVSLRKIPVNVRSLEELRKHPYLHKYSTAKAIVEYRRIYGKIENMEQLAFICGFTEAERQRLEPYICF